MGAPYLPQLHAPQFRLANAMTELTKLPLAALALVLAASAVQADPLPLKRGVSVHEWLNWSPVNEDRSYKWPPYIGEEQWLGGYRPLADWPEGDVFQTIAGLGFDFVRLSVDPGPLASTEGTKQAEALDVIAAAITRINDAGLRVVLDLHGVSQVPQYSMDMVQGGLASCQLPIAVSTVASAARSCISAAWAASGTSHCRRLSSQTYLMSPRVPSWRKSISNV